MALDLLRRLLSCGKALSKLGLLPECRADGMADVRDLKSRGDFPRVGSTPTPGTITKPVKQRRLGGLLPSRS